MAEVFPSLGPAGLVLSLLAMTASVAACARRARFHSRDRLGILGAAMMAAAAAILALTTAPTNILPGLLIAFPLLPAGILLLQTARSD